MQDDDAGALLPMEVLARILPLAWDTLEQARSLMSVCRAFQLEADAPAFWSRWLERRERELFAAAEAHDPALLKTLQLLPYQRLPAPIMAMGMRAVVQSKMPPVQIAGQACFGQTMRLQLFEGQLDGNGERNGPCALYFNDGDGFFGTLRNGVFSGTGAYHWQCGMRYEGGFNRQFRAGPGRIAFVDGSVFESGDFRMLPDGAPAPAAAETRDDDGDDSDDVYADVTQAGGSKADGVLTVLTDAGEKSCAATLETVGFEWKDNQWFDDIPLFRIVAGDVVYGVRAHIGVLERTDMVFRQGMWEFVGRFDRH